MSEESRNYLVRLLYGDVSLVITFWVFNVIVTVIAFILLIGIVGIPILYFIVVSFLLIALYNSAGKYNGFGLWKVLAYLYAISSLVGVFFIY